MPTSRSHASSLRWLIDRRAGRPQCPGRMAAKSHVAAFPVVEADPSSDPGASPAQLAQNRNSDPCESMGWPKSRHYISGSVSSGGQTRRQHEVIRADALGQDDAEASEECRLGVVRLRDATQSDVAHRGCRQNDIVGLDACQFLEDGPRRITETGALLPHLQGLPQDEGEEADGDVGVHAILAPMPDAPPARICAPGDDRAPCTAGPC